MKQENNVSNTLKDFFFTLPEMLAAITIFQVNQESHSIGPYKREKQNYWQFENLNLCMPGKFQEIISLERKIYFNFSHTFYPGGTLEIILENWKTIGKAQQCN